MSNIYLFFLFLLLLTACQQKADRSENIPIRPVQVVKVGSLGTIDNSYTGTVEAEEFSILAFKVSGTITDFPVTESIRQITSSNTKLPKPIIRRQNPFTNAPGGYWNKTQRLFKTSKLPAPITSKLPLPSILPDVHWDIRNLQLRSGDLLKKNMPKTFRKY